MYFHFHIPAMVTMNCADSTRRQGNVQIFALTFSRCNKLAAAQHSVRIWKILQFSAVICHGCFQLSAPHTLQVLVSRSLGTEYDSLFRTQFGVGRMWSTLASIIAKSNFYLPIYVAKLPEQGIMQPIKQDLVNKRIRLPGQCSLLLQTFSICALLRYSRNLFNCILSE